VGALNARRQNREGKVPADRGRKKKKEAQILMRSGRITLFRKGKKPPTCLKRICNERKKDVE